MLLVCVCLSDQECEAVPEAAAAVHPDHLHAARRRDPAQQLGRPLPLAAQGAHVCAGVSGGFAAHTHTHLTHTNLF